MKIWLSGSPLGDGGTDIPAYEAAAKLLREKGHEVVTPGEVQPWQHAGELCPGPITHLGHAKQCFTRSRIRTMLECDAVVLMDSWYNDNTSRAERRAAGASGLTVYRSTHEVPRGITGLRLDPGTAEIMAEIKAMDYPHAKGDGAAELLSEVDDEEETDPEGWGNRNAYERGLSDGEDAFWRKLGAAFVVNGHSERCAALRVAEVAIEPMMLVGDKESMQQFAERMQRHGAEWMRRNGYREGYARTAQEAIRQMILFVTGKEVEE